ncbi:site-specific DNA-methyltransferase [Ruminococcus bromii]|jgi:adenine-specific DNA-methyltransferase|nr:site-specific DNA-methyltransferase [Ruminococcus bromii]MBT9620421.1 site-specific DNA-methyltransferase [Ruminococcus bromii]
MDKLKMQTANKADENFKRLAEMFPNAVTEAKDENGEVVRAIDKDVLMQEINTKVVDGKEERYQFTWPDKKKSVLLANAPINKTLRPCREESVDFDNTENLYIEGDNLEVLKLLQETYLGKIKMIYIDPPYNTGGDFVYDDDFVQNTAEYLANSGQYDDVGNKLVTNTESNGRFHTDWLNMMYPRLKIAKDLLTDDGVIFAHIDDNEVENLGKLCNDVFGEDNFINIITVKTKIGGVSGSSEGKSLKDVTEFIWVYAKNKNELLLKPVYNHIPLFDRIQSYLDEGKSWKYTSIITKLEGKVLLKRDEKHDMNFYGYTTLETQSISSYAKENGISEQDVYNRYADKIFRTTNAQSSVRQTVIKETKGFEYPMFSCEYVPIKGKNEGKKIEILYKSGSTDDQRNMVMFLSDVVKKIDGVYYYLDKVSSLWDDIDYNNLTKEGDIEFANGKKPIKLLQRIINLATKDDSYILDFFSGSASTAHAVVQQNLEDNGTRKFIMVQIPEETDAKSNARKAGFRTICEIGKERIRRAGQKIRNEQLGIKNEGDNSSLQTPNSSLDTGFRVLKCDTSNMKDVYYNPAEYEPSLFSSLEDNIKEDRTPEDLLFQVMLDLGILLSSKIQVRSEKVGMRNYSYFDVEDGYLIACFDKNIDEEVITAIAKQKPYYFVMRDSSMANDSVATNFEQIFASYSPDTVRKVL